MLDAQPPQPRDRFAADARLRHYKGGTYTFVGFAQHSEDLTDYAVYTNADGQIWVRPAEMFLGTVEGPDGPVVRFEVID